MVKNRTLYQPVVKMEAGWLEKVIKAIKMLSPKRWLSLMKKASDDIINR